MTFGEALKKAMNVKNMNAKELSVASGVTESYISKLLHGRFKDPTFTKDCAIINGLGFSLDEFAGIQFKGEDL